MKYYKKILPEHMVEGKYYAVLLGPSNPAEVYLKIVDGQLYIRPKGSRLWGKRSLSWTCSTTVYEIPKNELFMELI